MLKKIAALTVILLFASLPALSGTIDFEGSGAGGKWSWNGSGPLTANSLSMGVRIVGSPQNHVISMASETFTSGAFLGGDGTQSDPWMFGPSGTFTITGCVPPAKTCTPVTLFTGSFTSNEMDMQGSNSMLFSATTVTGTVDPALLTFLGLPSSPDTYLGTYQVTLDGSAPGSGLVASGDLVISPTSSTTPESGSLLLMGIGLLGVAALASRRKLTTT